MACYKEATEDVDDISPAAPDVDAPQIAAQEARSANGGPVLALEPLKLEDAGTQEGNVLDEGLSPISATPPPAGAKEILAVNELPVIEAPVSLPPVQKAADKAEEVPVAQTPLTLEPPSSTVNTLVPDDCLEWMVVEQEALAPALQLLTNPPAWAAASAAAGETLATEAAAAAGTSAAKSPVSANGSSNPAFEIAQAANADSRMADIPTARMQVELDDGWCDLSEEETKQICFNVAAGASRFATSARGTLYIIDLSGADGATQMNSKTGKTRRLRILDSENVMSLDEPDTSTPEVNEEQARD